MIMIMIDVDVNGMRQFSSHILYNIINLSQRVFAPVIKIKFEKKIWCDIVEMMMNLKEEVNE